MWIPQFSFSVYFVFFESYMTKTNVAFTCSIYFCESQKWMQGSFQTVMVPLLLPPASAVEVIESEPCFCLCVCVCAKGVYIWGTREVREHSGIFIVSWKIKKSFYRYFRKINAQWPVELVIMSCLPNMVHHA